MQGSTKHLVFPSCDLNVLKTSAKFPDHDFTVDVIVTIMSRRFITMKI